MKESEVDAKTKYFGAGVVASIWCYSGEGQWAVNIRRNQDIRFHAITALVKALRELKIQESKGQFPVEMYPEHMDQYACSVVLYNREDVRELTSELAKAVAFIQGTGTDIDWQETSFADVTNVAAEGGA